MTQFRRFAMLAGALGLITAPSLALIAPGATTPAGAAAPQAGTELRVATFNVRTARALHDRQSWEQRAPKVAEEILSRLPGVVALQELGPGRADGHRGTLHGQPRQTTSLTDALATLGGSQYVLVRTTPYVPPSARHGTQGARILYDSSRYALQSDCPETTGTHSYSSSCSIELPVAAGDGDRSIRTAAYARFRDRRSGREFYVVSAHLDSRHSPAGDTEATYDDLRARQAMVVADTMAAIDTDQVPVILGGDLNSWERDRGHYAPHRALVGQGYEDAVDAPERINDDYPTINHFDTTLRRARNGAPARLDVVMLRGGDGAQRYENKTTPVDPARPSDHNLVVADFVI